MGWAKVALVSGVLVVLGAFGVGTEVTRSVAMADHVQACGSAIPSSWLLSGTSYERTTPGPSATADERAAAAAASADDRAAAAACAPVVRQSRVLVLTAIGLGGLLVLLGASALRPPARPDRPRVLVHA